MGHCIKIGHQPHLDLFQLQRCSVWEINNGCMFLTFFLLPMSEILKLFGLNNPVILKKKNIEDIK